MRYAEIVNMPAQMPEAEALAHGRLRFLARHPEATDVEVSFAAPMLVLEDHPPTNVVRVEATLPD